MEDVQSAGIRHARIGRALPPGARYGRDEETPNVVGQRREVARPIGRRKRIRRRRGVAIGLAGELDILCLPALRAALRASLGDTLGDALGSRRRVWVDLSRVTFVDSLCMTELVVQYLLHSGRLVLWRPSPEVRLTLAICELEDWVSFHPDPAAGKRDLPPEA